MSKNNQKTKAKGSVAKKVIATTLVLSAFAGATAVCLTNENVRTTLGIGSEKTTISETPEQKEIKQLKETMSSLQKTYDSIKEERDSNAVELSNYKSQLLSEQQLTAEQKLRLAEYEERLLQSDAQIDEVKEELEDYKSQLLAEQQLTAEQSAKIEQYESAIAEKDTTLSALESQLEEYRIRIDILQNQLYNPLAEKMNYIKFASNVSLGTINQSYTYDDDNVLIVNQSSIIKLQLSTGEISTVLSFNTTYKPVIRQVDSKTLIIAYCLNSSTYAAKVIRFDLENMTYDNLKFYDESNAEITSTIKYVYCGATLNDGSTYIFTGANGGIFKLEDDRAVMISTLNNAKVCTVIDDDIYFKSTYGYKISDGTVTQFAGESTCGDNFIKDAYGNLVSYTSGTYNTSAYLFDETTGVFGDVVTLNSGNLTLHGALIKSQDSTTTKYLNPHTKTFEVVTDNYITNYVGVTDTHYIYHYSSHLNCINKIDGTSTIVDVGYVCHIMDMGNGKYYLAPNSKSDNASIFDASDFSVESVNIKGGIQVSTQSYRNIYYIDDTNALLYNPGESDNASNNTLYVAIYNYQTNTITNQFIMQTHDSYVVHDGWFYSYGFYSIERINLTTFEVQSVQRDYKYSFTNGKPLQLNDDKTKILLLDNKYSCVLDIDTFTLEDINIAQAQYKDYYYSYNTSVNYTVWYDFNTGKIHYTDGPLTKVNICGNEYMYCNDSINGYGLYYIA